MALGLVVRLLALAAIAALAGCSSDNPAVVGGDAVRAVMTQLQQPGGGDFTEPTRAMIDAEARPLLRARIASRDANALLPLLSVSGPVETWTTLGAITVSLRNGVLVQTRGLGPDLMSASVPDAAVLARGAGTVNRRHFYLGPNDATVALTFTCVVADEGRERVTISGLTYDTRRVSESCAGDGESFRNLYWFQSGARIRQSVQWIGPETGSIELFDLRR